ncbi:nucleotide-binding domain-containing protein [Aureobasidium subglaciale]|nr:nucleotide-binding domain-containing protein [Aureobasidium subglaciale]
MGVYDLIHKSWKTLRTAIKALLDLNRTFQALVARINHGPSLPNRNPTKSYWLENPPFPELVNTRSNELPTETDVIIIGSGITGAAVARSLLQEGKRNGRDINITILEARDICSGATGRNGGHIKVSPHESLEAFEKKFGTERAVALTKFQLRHLECLTELCRVESFVEAECRVVETVDLFLDQKAFDKACHTLGRMKTLLPEFEMHSYQRKDAREKFAVSDHVVGALSYRAGAIWPYRFVTAVWNKLLQESYLSNEGSLPDALTRSAPIEVSSSATTSFMLPTPGWVTYCPRSRAILQAQEPTCLRKTLDTTAIQGFHGDRSWSIVYGDNDYDYMTQRPSPDGMSDIMLGGGTFRSKDNGLDQIGVWDDSQIDAFTSAHLAGILPIIFSSKTQQPNTQKSARSLQQHWSGIIALTADSLPFVGELDAGLSGRGSVTEDASEWISAGYNGQGMVYAWLCGTALGIIITGSELEDIPASPGFPGGVLSEWFPKEMLLDRKRYDKIDILDLADEL